MNPARPKSKADGMELLARGQYNLEARLGNSCVQVDANGALISREEYYPFGETSFGSFAKKRYRYNGKERDEESGLYNYGMRYYAAWTCRFVSVDPLAADYTYYTPYQYAGNKPINFIDLDGLEEAVPNSGGSVVGTLNGVDTHVWLAEAVIVGDKEFGNSWWDGFIHLVVTFEENIKGNAKWKIGIEFKSKNGNWNGQEGSPLSKEFRSLLTIENWDEVTEILNILGVVHNKDASKELFQTYNIPTPKGLGAFNKLRSINKGTGKNMPWDASKALKELQKNIRDLNKNYKNQKPGSTVTGGFNVAGNTNDLIEDRYRNYIKIFFDTNESSDTVSIPHPKEGTGGIYFPGDTVFTRRVTYNFIDHVLKDEVIKIWPSR